MSIADIVSIGAVLVALGALIWQAWEAQRQARLQTFTAYTERYERIMLNLPVNIESDQFDFDQLDSAARDDTMRWLRAYYDLCSEEHYLHERRLIDSKVWALWESGMRDSMRRAAYRFAWTELQAVQYYPREFGKFVQFVGEQR